MFVDQFLQEIKKNLKKFSQRFEAQDRLRQSTVSTEILEKRRQLVYEFEQFRNEAEKEWAATKEERIAMRNGE